MRALLNRLKFLLRRPAFDRDLAEEIEMHRSLRQANLEASGLSPEEASLASRRALGNVTLAREDARDAWMLRWLDDAVRDVGYAGRMLRRSPSFTVTAVLCLSLGIGASTAVFTVIDAVTFAPLPVADPGRLVVIEPITTRGERTNVSYAQFESIRAPDAIFTGVFAALDGTYLLEAAGQDGNRHLEPLRVQAVSGEYFEVLGIQMALGRPLARADDTLGHPAAVAVISHRCWRRRFGGDPSVVGQRLTIKREPLTIVGVAPDGFFGESVGRAPDIWVPLTLQPALDPPTLLADPRVGWLRVMGRLHAGVGVVAARDALNVQLRQRRTDGGELGRSLRHFDGMAVDSGRRGLPDTRTKFARQLWILMAVVAVVLLVACANVASLLLARATARRRETAVRLAVGASTGRLVRQFLAEHALLGAVSALGGLLIAAWGSQALVALASDGSSRLAIDLALNARVLGFALLTTACAVAGFGLAATGAAVRRTASAERPAARRTRLAPAQVLVAGQIALSLLLLCAAGLFLQTLLNLRAFDPGFAAAEIVQAALDPRQAGGPGALRLGREIVDRLSAVPGVRSVSLATSGFRTGIARTCCLAAPGHVPDAGENREVQTINVTPGYFETMGVPIVDGRPFVPADVDRAATGLGSVAIANEALVRQYFGAASPLPKRVGWGDPPAVRHDIEIVGVVGNVVHGDLRGSPRALLYFPTASARHVIVRSALPAPLMTGTVRREIHAVAPDLEIDVSSVPQVMEQSLVLERLLARLAGFFGVVALLLAGIGLYGLTSYGVTRRTREIAIRMALGAGRQTVVRLIVFEALALVAVGSGAGAAAAWTVTRLLNSLLFGVSPADPVSFALAAGLLALTGLVAAVLPARRAASIQPTLALRHE